MRILYAGLPLGALQLSRLGHEVAAALVAGRDRQGLRRLRSIAAAARAPVLVDPDLADPEVLRLLRSTRPDVFASFYWPRRIPEAALSIAPFRYGVHPSLLPRHRGADPIFWTILRGDSETGVTAHVLESAVDTGPILACEKVPVGEEVTSGALWRTLERISLGLLGRMADAVARGEVPATQSQNESLATVAPAPSDEDLEIRWEAPAESILRLVRAASPDPGAFTGFGETTLTVLAASPTSHPMPPGVVGFLEEGVCVGTGTTAIALRRVCLGGGDPIGGADVVDALLGRK